MGLILSHSVEIEGAKQQAFLIHMRLRPCYIYSNQKNGTLRFADAPPSIYRLATAIWTAERVSETCQLDAYLLGEWA